MHDFHLTFQNARNGKGKNRGDWQKHQQMTTLNTLITFPLFLLSFLSPVFLVHPSHHFYPPLSQYPQPLFIPQNVNSLPRSLLSHSCHAFSHSPRRTYPLHDSTIPVLVFIPTNLIYSTAYCISVWTSRRQVNVGTLVTVGSGRLVNITQITTYARNRSRHSDVLLYSLYVHVHLCIFSLKRWDVCIFYVCTSTILLTF